MQVLINLNCNIVMINSRLICLSNVVLNGIEVFVLNVLVVMVVVLCDFFSILVIVESKLINNMVIQRLMVFMFIVSDIKNFDWVRGNSQKQRIELSFLKIDVKFMIEVILWVFDVVFMV